MAKISIIIRTKNEEKWINSCLRAVFDQNFRDFEVILVDNESTDSTLEIAKNYDLKIINYTASYRPAHALNTGIINSSGSYIVCLSGHCIPTSSEWLQNLLRNFDNPKVAGVYGRQEPLPYSSPKDKRDLWTIFGLDKKVQFKDSFFHNANSMLRRDLWEATPFDETLTNIEDRIWAKQVIEKGFHLIYEPESSVFHWHGIHQDGDDSRARNVVRILENHNIHTSRIRTSPETDLSVSAIIPVKGKSLQIGTKSLLAYTIGQALDSELVGDVFVVTDDKDTAKAAEALGAKVPFIRPKELSYEYVGLGKVLDFTINQLKEAGCAPDIGVILQESSPFRATDLIDTLVRELLYTGVDTLIPVCKERKLLFKKEGEQVLPVDDGFMPQKFKEPFFSSMLGLGIVTKSNYLQNGNLFAGDIGIHPIDDRLAALKISSKKDAARFGNLLTTLPETSKY